MEHKIIELMLWQLIEHYENAYHVAHHNGFIHQMRYYCKKLITLYATLENLFIEIFVNECVPETTQLLIQNGINHNYKNQIIYI